jgi:ribosomal protein S18 acetylase RimI-like enzyme
MLEMMYSEDSLRSQMKEGSKFIIVYNNERPVGFAAYQKLTPEKFKLHKIYILPSQQKKGTGRFIIDHILTIVKEKGGSSLHLQVNKNNKAKEFYERLGFKEIETIKLDIGKGYFMDDYIMEKSIN